MDSESQLVLHRPAGWVGRARRIRVFVDGADVGQLGSGDRQVVDVDAGTHVVRAAFGTSDVSEPLQIDVADGFPVSVAVTFRDPRSIPAPGVGGDWQRRSLELKIAAEGSVQQLGLSQTMSSVTGRRSKAEWVVWTVALAAACAGLALRSVSDWAGTVIAAVGDAVIVAMFLRRMLFRGRA